MRKRLIIHLIINSLLITGLLGVYISLPKTYQSLDNRLRDFMFISRGKVDDSKMISIVTIDEPSLKALGQWPWERTKIARMLENLTTAGATIIALDVFFSEQDKSSPQYVIHSLGLDKSLDKKLVTSLPDYDQIMAQTIGQTPTILGYIFDLKKARNSEQFPIINATISEKNFANTEFLPQAKGVTLNLEQFQESAFSSGFINSLPDESGMIRRVPLLMKYQEVVFTSLAMEVFRLVSGLDAININYEHTGISSLELVYDGGSAIIPTDRNGRLALNFLGPQKSFTYISAKDVIANTFDKTLVKDKIILFGATSVGLMDLRATPFDNALPGIEVHATAIENMIKQDYLQEPDWSEGATTLLLIVIMLFLTLLYSFLPAHWTVLLMCFSLYGLYVFFDFMLFQQGLILNMLFPLVCVVLLTISSTLLNYFLENKQRKKIRDRFSQKVSAAVVDDIMRQGSTDLLIAQEREISIFFSDIRGFTNISEALASPTKLIDMLNIYMTPMVESIMHHQGTVDKFIGDAIMAYWNAPHHVNNHADKAIQSALQQMQQLKRVNQFLLQKYQLSIDIGIGINTGQATVGEMGSKGRSDYTIIGDSVNLASRLEGLNKPYGSNIIISEFTLAQAKANYVIRELDKVRVKGKKEGITIYEVLQEGTAQEPLISLLKRYNEALECYKKAQFIDAMALFEQLKATEEKTTLYELYIARCQNYIDHPPSDFDGVYTFTTK